MESVLNNRPEFIAKLYLGDCLEIMKDIPDESVNLVLCDLPYGTTACKWDIQIPLVELWKEYERIVKPDSAIVLFGSQPFTSLLVSSNIESFRYEWIWQKAVGSNFACLKYQPMKEHENILVFSVKSHRYYPIKEPRKGTGAKRLEAGYKSNTVAGDFIANLEYERKGKKFDDLRFPSSVQYFNNRESTRGLHPTQKPVALLEYLIKTYTVEGDTVLDNTMGSGSTGVAAKNTGRHFIGIEKDSKYFDIAKERLHG